MDWECANKAITSAGLYTKKSKTGLNKALRLCVQSVLQLHMKERIDKNSENTIENSIFLWFCCVIVALFLWGFTRFIHSFSHVISQQPDWAASKEAGRRFRTKSRALDIVQSCASEGLVRTLSDLLSLIKSLKQQKVDKNQQRAVFSYFYRYDRYKRGGSKKGCFLVDFTFGRFGQNVKFVKIGGKWAKTRKNVPGHP